MSATPPTVQTAGGTSIQAQPVMSVDTAGNYAGEGSTVNAAAVIVSQTPTTSASPAYSIGDCVGGLMVFAGMARASVGSGLLQTVTLACKTAQTAALDLVLFNANPSLTTFTDNAAYALNVGDIPKVSFVVHLTDWTAQGGPSFAEASQLATVFAAATPGSTTLYGVLVARAALTLGSTSDLTATLKGWAD